MEEPKVTIKDFRVRGYRSCTNTAFTLRPEHSVLIGPNGSGKTNILQSLNLLRHIADRNSRVHSTQDPLASTCVLEATFIVGGKDLPYRASVTYTTNERNREEILTAIEEWRLGSFIEDNEWTRIDTSFMDPRFLGAELDFKRMSARQRDFLSERVNPHFFHKNVGPALRAVLRFRSGIRYYSASVFTDPSQCPSHFEVEEDGRLRTAYGTNPPHTGFLYALYKEKEMNPVGYSRFLSIVGKQGMRLLDRISWKEVAVSSNTVNVKPGGRLEKRKATRRIVIPNVHIGNAALSFNQLSEGTFKSLALIFYVITAKSELMLIEEPEVCVHHGLLTSIIEIFKTYSKRKQFVISTHSDFLLDLVSHENVFSVSRTAAGTSVRLLTDKLTSKQLKALKKFLETSGNLGEYWRQGGLEL